MTKATHTPGPWRVSTSGNVVADQPDGSHVFVAYPKHPEQPTVEHPMRDANAALIAAAPELLDSARLLLGWIDGQKSIGTLPSGIDFPAARAAIAKAEGRS